MSDSQHSHRKDRIRPSQMPVSGTCSTSPQAPPLSSKKSASISYHIMLHGTERTNQGPHRLLQADLRGHIRVCQRRSASLASRELSDANPPIIQETSICLSSLDKNENMSSSDRFPLKPRGKQKLKQMEGKAWLATSFPFGPFGTARSGFCWRPLLGEKPKSAHSFAPNSAPRSPQLREHTRHGAVRLEKVDLRGSGPTVDGKAKSS